MLRPIHLVRVLGAVAAFASAGQALAAPPEDPKKRAAAEALYDLAKQAMEQRDYATACPKLEEALRILPGKIGSMKKLAECYEVAGKLVAAGTAYDAAAKAAEAASDARAGELRQKAGSVGKSVPVLVIVVPDGMRGWAGLVVRRDGEEVAAGDWGKPLRLDPGHHEVKVEAAGKKAWSAPAELSAGGGPVKLEVPLLGAAGTQGGADTPPAPATTPPSGRGAWPWVVGGAGAAALVIAIGVGADGLAALGRIKSNCGPSFATQPCQALVSTYDPTGDNARKDRDLGLFVGFGVAGAAALTAGVVGLVSKPSASQAQSTGAVAPVVWPGGGGLVAHGAF